MTLPFWITCLALIPFLTGAASLIIRDNVRLLCGVFCVSGIALPIVAISGLWMIAGAGAGEGAPGYISSLPSIPLTLAACYAIAAAVPAWIKWRYACAGAAAALMFFALLVPVVTVFPIEPQTISTDGLILPIAFRLDGLSAVFTLMISLLWLPALLYALSYMHDNDEEGLPGFFFFYTAAVAFALLLGLSGNAITLFVFYEALSLSTFPLVTHNRDERARRSGRIYLTLLLFGSLALLLPGLALFYAETGTLDFTGGGHAIADKPWLTLTITALLVFGAAKSGLMPLHRWLPAAMVAPTPVSALLHAVAVVKAGVFTVIKCVFLLVGPEHISTALDAVGLSWNPILYLAIFTLLIASSVALFQEHLKKLLAYSTISQLAYIVMAALIAAPGAMTAAMTHMTAHAFGKITLFFAAGAFYTVMKRTLTVELDGASRVMPVTTAAFSLAALSMIGLPPLAGFWGKWYIFEATFTAGNYVPVIALTLSTLLNAGYFLPLVYRMYFARPKHADGSPAFFEADEPPLMQFALVFTTALAVCLFFYPEAVTQPVSHVDISLPAEALDE